jgi:hypothetical protein
MCQDISVLGQVKMAGGSNLLPVYIYIRACTVENLIQKNVRLKTNYLFLILARKNRLPLWCTTTSMHGFSGFAAMLTPEQAKQLAGMHHLI